MDLPSIASSPAAYQAQSSFRSFSSLQQAPRQGEPSADAMLASLIAGTDDDGSAA